MSHLAAVRMLETPYVCPGLPAGDAAERRADNLSRSVPWLGEMGTEQVNLRTRKQKRL